MPLKSYGVLKGKAIDSKNGMGINPHFQVLISDDDLLYRIAVNVKSKVEPSALLYFVDENFNHPVLEDLIKMPFGFHALERRPTRLALDYIRGNLFDPGKMKPLPHDIPGPDNDLNELMHKYISKAIALENSVLYAFGEKWGPEVQRDKYFGFKPGNGIHDIHMNQGSSGNWKKYDGIWQDGGLMIHLPDEEKWIGIFLAFQSQCFHTDDINGNLIPESCAKELSKDVRIIAALINPEGHDSGLETVTLINATPNPIDLKGWALADANKRKAFLDGIIAAGETMKIPLSGKNIQLSNKGGIITLLNFKGLKIDGVAYTKKESAKQGWTMVF